MKTRRARPWDWLNRIGIAVLDAAFRVLAKQDYQGLERIPRQGSAVVVCNHMSVADPLVLAVAIRRAGRVPRFLAKIEVFRSAQTLTLGARSTWGHADVLDAGVRRARLHDARHKAATLLLTQGVPARVVMEILGHSQITSTLGTYSHVAPEIAREAASRVASALWDEAS